METPTAQEVYHFAVYGTLRDDCDALSKQEWTQKFCTGLTATPLTALVHGMKMVYKQLVSENWPYAIQSDSSSDSIVVRVLQFRDNWAEKLKEADDVEQYDPDAPDSSPLGYRRKVVPAIVLDADNNPTDQVVYAVMYYIADLEPNSQYYSVLNGDWLQRDIAYHSQPQPIAQQE